MILTEIEVIYNVTVDVTPQYRWLGASFLLTTVYSVRPAAGVISLCRVVCRQNRGFGSKLDTGITCLSWSSPNTVPRPPPTPDLLTTVYRVSLEFSLLLNCPRIGIFLLLRTPGPVPLGLAYVLPVETNPDTTWPWMWHPNTYNRAHQYTEELELSLFVLLFSAKIWRFLLLYCVGTTCSGLALLNKCMTWCLYKLSANMPTTPPPLPFSAAAATDQNGVSKYVILYMKIHRAPG